MMCCMHTPYSVDHDDAIAGGVSGGVVFIISSSGTVTLVVYIWNKKKYVSGSELHTRTM